MWEPEENLSPELVGEYLLSVNKGTICSITNQSSPDNNVLVKCAPMD